MVKIIQDDRINELIHKMIPKQLLDQGPIIAGGSILAQYILPYYASQVFRPDDLKSKFLHVFNLEKKFSYEAQRKWLKSYMDIDIWFDQDHQFWDESNPGNILVKGYDKNTIHSLPYSSFLQYGIYQPVRSSVYANTYNPVNPDGLTNRQIQIIREPAKSIESLIESFDFTNVSIAWYNDSVYILDGLDEAFANKELRANRDTLYCDLNISSKIYQGLRAFKYVDRYSLQMSPSLCKQILDIYLDIGIYRANESKTVTNNSVQLNGGPYGTRTVTTAYVDKQLNMFIEKFDSFVKMNNFKPEWLFYVVSIIPDIQKYIDRFSVDGKYVENCFAGHTNNDIMLAAFGRS